MITLANIRRAIYNISKRLDILEARDSSGLNSTGFSGDYNDLSNKPTIPAAQILSDWNLNDDTKLDYIKNKPTVTNGTDGLNGLDGVTPHIDPTSKHWMIGNTDTGIVAEGLDGTTPTIPGSENASSGGNTLSLVTTGEKYIWNNKANVWRGTLAEYDLILTKDSNTIYIITSGT